MDVKQIVTEWLNEHGYEGLFLPGDCGCGLDDLMRCEECCDSCEPGYKLPSDDPEEGEYMIRRTRDTAGQAEPQED